MSALRVIEAFAGWLEELSFLLEAQPGRTSPTGLFLSGRFPCPLEGTRGGPWLEAIIEIGDEDLDPGRGPA